LLLVAFILFRPGFFWDFAFPPYTERPARDIEAVVRDVPDGGFLYLDVAGETILGDRVNRLVALRAGEASKSPRERLAGAGLQLRETAGEVQVLAVAFGSSAAKAGIRTGWTIRNVLVAADRPAKEWMFIPALVVLGAVVAIQRRRRTR
jgi:hypothetical protein